MEVAAGYIGAFIIGLILGLMGGGGSILTVPLLVYVMAINPVTATAYSLFIVGTTSAFGSFQNYLKDNLSVKTGLMVALPSLVTVYLTRLYIVPAIPKVVFSTPTLEITKEIFIMLLFAIIMLVASLSMLRKKSGDLNKMNNDPGYFYILPFIIAIGLLTGVVGSGGGFLIIPVLIFFAGLPMKKAVGTSLFIIAINSLTGFAGDIQVINIDWTFLLSFTVISIFGIFAGTYLHKHIHGSVLKRCFGWFVLVMALFILSKEIIGY